MMRDSTGTLTTLPFTKLLARAGVLSALVLFVFGCSRYADAYDPDCPPIPMDDPASHQYMRCFGGIGTMNIMLATVTERTREIGIRRAIGAKRRDIMQQFLTETLVLTGTGGLLGVICGLMVGPLFRGLRNVVTAISSDALPQIVYTLEPRIAPWSIGLSLFISLGTGLIFGLYPARRAAMMSPIEALRHE